MTLRIQVLPYHIIIHFFFRRNTNHRIEKYTRRYLPPVYVKSLLIRVTLPANARVYCYFEFLGSSVVILFLVVFNFWIMCFFEDVLNFKIEFILEVALIFKVIFLFCIICNIEVVLYLVFLFIAFRIILKLS